MCCSREHYPAVAKEWTASDGENHRPWPPLVKPPEWFSHAHLALEHDWGVCITSLDNTGPWEDWPLTSVRVTRFKVATSGDPPVPEGVDGTGSIWSYFDKTWGLRWEQSAGVMAKRGITTLGQAVLWVTEGDCLQQVGYLPETPTYAEWLKMDTLVRPH